MNEWGMTRDDLIKAIKNRINKIEQHAGRKVIIDDWEKYVPEGIMDIVEHHSKLEFSEPEDMFIAWLSKIIMLIADFCRHVTGYFVDGLGEVIRSNFDTPSLSIEDTRTLVENYFNTENFLGIRPFHDPNACVVYELPKFDNVDET